MHRIGMAALRTPGLGKILGRLFPQAAPHLLWSLAAARKAKEIAPEVVEAPEHGGDGFFWSLRQGSRLVIKLHGPMALCDRHNGQQLRPRDLRLLSWLERTSVRRAGRVVSLNRYLGELGMRGWRLQKEPEVVPCPVDVERYRPADSPGSGGNGRSGTILFVGRLEERKGIDVLLRAFREVAPKYTGWNLRLVGAGERCVWTGKGKLGENGNIEMVGRLEGAELDQAYRQADVVVVPSRWENSPAVCLEAMAQGCALVASRCGGIPEMVSDGVEGILVEPGSATELASALQRLMESPALRAEMGLAGRARAEAQFSLDSVARQMLEVYRGVAQARSG